MSNEDDPCFHSMQVSGCYSCLRGLRSRQDAHIDRLRLMLVDAGESEALIAHDAHWFGGNARPLPEPSHSGQEEP